ncbi:helix-turn-helix domain-containing protein [Hwanghaeella sp.]|uniref:helix-turn-helix domain-containing protein n=1 Tax=Hwanghaeella sp. TaxID=2605943 RepID=UPI003CCBAF65
MSDSFTRVHYTGKETEERLGIGPTTRYRWINKGILPSFMIGGRRVHPADAIDRIAAEGVELPKEAA